jgi:hypothetical protein
MLTLSSVFYPGAGRRKPGTTPGAPSFLTSGKLARRPTRGAMQHIVFALKVWAWLKRTVAAVLEIELHARRRPSTPYAVDHVSDTVAHDDLRRTGTRPSRTRAAAHTQKNELHPSLTRRRLDVRRNAMAPARRRVG